MKIIINKIEVDLHKIGINFILNVDQLAALDHLAKFMMSDKLTTVLNGSGGTGKSTLMRIFIEYDRIKYGSNVRLVAPTHKAKSVLSRLSNNSFATTLHKMLGLKPNFNIAEFDARTISFLDALHLPFFETKKDLFIVDECSMINNDLYDLLIKKLSNNGKIIFLGDHKQLSPVRQGSGSKVFDKTDFPGFTLNIIERQQQNPLVETLVKLRTNENVIYESTTNAEKGLRVHNLSSFKKVLSKIFYCLDDLNASPQGNKILAYTNSRVTGFNNFVRKLMGIDKKPLNVGEHLMAFDSYNSGYEELITNGSEYTVKSLKLTEKAIPSYGLFKGYNLELIEYGTDIVKEVFLLDPEAPQKLYDHLAIVLEGARVTAIKKNYLWKNFFAINQSFVTMRELVYEKRVIKKKTFDYGYACTVHKSQGSSYTNVFVDMDNIHLCKDLEERRQLEYVALSRPTHFAHILVK